MSDTMTEGVIVEWHKKIGDDVKAGDLLAEIETDKATMELESYQSGILLHIGAETGKAVPVNSIIAILGEKGEDISAVLEEEAKQATAVEKEEVKEVAEVKAAAPQASTPIPAQTPPPAKTPIPAHIPATVKNSNGRIKASPLAKKMASDQNIDIALIQGSGEEGRIVKKDIENFIANGGAQAVAPSNGQHSAPAIVLPQIVGEEQFEDVPNSQMRKVIARRLGESKFQAPHFYLTMEINMDKAVEMRAALKESSPVKISFNDIVVKAAALALRQHPQVNSSWMGDYIRYNKHIHIGVAVAVDEGLLVPVIKFADNKGLSHISTEVRTLAGKAKNKKLSTEEMTGNTFTISNLGMMDIDNFTAIINPPDACIMAVGRIAKLPRVDENGEIVVNNIMKVNLSCDHRAVDGAVGARFLQSFKSFLEEPYRMLV